MAALDENRRAVGTLNPMRDKKNEGPYQGGGGKGTTPVTTACPEEKTAEGKTSYELVWLESKSDDGK